MSKDDELRCDCCNQKVSSTLNRVCDECAILISAVSRMDFLHGVREDAFWKLHSRIVKGAK